RYEYDGRNRKYREIRPDPAGRPGFAGPTTTYFYDAVGNVVRADDPVANDPATGAAEAVRHRSVARYDALNRKVATGVGQRAVQSVTASGQTVTVQLANHGYAAGDLILVESVAAAYAGARRVTGVVSDDSFTYEITAPSAPPAPGDLTVADAARTTAYDATGQVLAEADPRGNVTGHTYDLLGRRTGDRFADGTSTVMQYDVLGNLTKLTDGRGNATDYEYDHLNRKTKEILPEAGGNNEPGRATTTFFYDKAGRLTATTDAAGNKLLGPGATSVQQQAFVAANRHSTTYAYDALGRKVSERQPHAGPDLTAADAPLTRWGYDANGNVLWTIDPLGSAALPAEPSLAQLQDLIATNRHATTYAYDALNRKVRETLPDPDGNPANRTDGNPDNDAPTTRFGYDVSGNLLWTIDAAGNGLIGPNPTRSQIADLVARHQNAATYEYDALGRRTVEARPAAFAHGDSHVPTTRFGYDANGNTIWVIGPRVNALPGTTSDPAYAVKYQYATTYEYDAQGRKVRETLPDPDSDAATRGGDQSPPVTTFGYDAAGNLAWTMSPRGNALLGGAPSAAAVRDAVGRHQFTTTRTYDAMNRLSTETGPDPDQADAAVAPPTTRYGYDAAGNVKWVIDPLGNAELAAPGSTLTVGGMVA
ncbi:MAG TPA: hypothetical protein VK324_07645, partial [Tepidisphaeraceae bacterium]|nr:hypothetical protein [Tepidisphaeraceae bacterium]